MATRRITGKSKKIRGHLRTPSSGELRTYAGRDHIELSDEETEEFVPLVAGLLELLDQIEELPELLPELKYPQREPGHTPDGSNEDPYNAFTRICRIEGAATGPLAGKRVAVKDNLAIAGLPITNASRMTSYVPLVDAVVVERILDAGGTIVGKLNLDDSSSAGYGETSFFGPPRNPRKPTHSAGGSSGGAGSAVASGAVDMALGVDEGGSARIPAAFCGCVAIKATHGLVPSFGLSYFDHTIDYVCPLAASVADTATLLEVIAGDDWRDPQWVRGELKVGAYLEAANDDIRGQRVGLIEETLDPELCAPVVLEAMERSIQALREAGAEVERVSIPMFSSVPAIIMGVFLTGWPAMLRSDGLGYFHLGYVDVARVQATGVSRRQEATLLPPFVKLLLLTNSFLESHYLNSVFAKVHNQRLAFRRKIDKALERFNVLLTPTTPTTAPPLATDRMGETEQLRRMPQASVQWPFTQAFNLTGHPALVLPNGIDAEGLPTSIQIVAHRFNEYEAFRTGFLLERLLDLNLSTPGAAV